jgi:hypothetical protein
MDEKACNSVLLCTSTRHGTSGGWPTSPISHPGHTHRLPAALPQGHGPAARLFR